MDNYTSNAARQETLLERISRIEGQTGEVLAKLSAELNSAHRRIEFLERTLGDSSNNYPEPAACPPPSPYR